MGEFRRGVRLAFDWGKARIGVAACDPDGLLAFPVDTVPAANPWPRLGELVAEYQPFEIVIGLPLDLRGQRGPAAEYVLQKVGEFAQLLATPVRVVDERMSTVAASRRLGQAGKNTRKQRSLIDQAAAVEILRSAIDAEQRGVLGELIEVKGQL